MSLFQKSVLKKYLDELDDKAVRNAYTKFKAFFFDKEIDHMVYDLYELTEEEIVLVER